MARSGALISRDLRMWASRAFNRSLAPPDWLTINLTLRCNLSCTMCTTCYDSPELSTREVCDLVDQAADWGVRVFNPLGGEPFIRADLETILAHAARRDMHVTLTTNGTLIRPERAARIAAIPAEKLHVNISLDGPEAIHDQIRGEGSFRRAIAGYLAIRAADRAAGNPQRKICCNSILHRKNVEEYPAFIEELGAMGFDGVQVLNLFRNREDDTVGGMWFSPDSLPLLEQTIEALIGHSLVLNAASDLRLVPRYYREGLRPLDAPCWAGWKELYINADGSAIMCDGKLDFLGGRFGSTRESTLRQLWASPLLSERRQVVKTCTTPCIQNCYLRRESDSATALGAEVGAALRSRLGFQRSPRRLPQTLTLEACDTPDQANHPLLHRLFGGSPVGFAEVVADPDLYSGLRDRHYISFLRGFLGVGVAARIVDAIEESGMAYDTIALRWRGEPLLHPEFSELLATLAPRAERIVVESSGKLLTTHHVAVIRALPNVELWVNPALSETFSTATLQRAQSLGVPIGQPALAPGPVVSWEGRVTASRMDIRLEARAGDALKEPWAAIARRLESHFAA